MNTKICDTYLAITEEKNAFDYLEKAYFYISKKDKNLLDWKWIAIALHGAIYGFAICALKGSNYERVVFRDKRGIEKLIGFDEALDRCQKLKYMKMTIISKELVLNNEQKHSIKILKDILRNNFSHYIPCFWSIEVHGCPAMAIDVLSIINFLAFETGNYVSLSGNQKRKIKFYIEVGKLILKSSKLYKESSFGIQ